MFLEPKNLQQKVYDHYVFEANLGNPTLKHGIVRGVVELGVHTNELMQKPKHSIKNISVEDELDEIYTDEVVYFDEKPKIIRRKQYVLIIEFPDIIVDPDRILYGVSNPKPLRLANCAINYNTEISIVYRPMLASWRHYKTETGVKTTMSESCTLYKMLLNRNLIKPGKRVISEQTGRLMDESFMFDVQLYHHNARYIKTKIFFRDDYKLDNPVTLKSGFYIGFNRDNNLDAPKTLDTHVINTIKRSDKYHGSLIEQQINLLEREHR